MEDNVVLKIKENKGGSTDTQIKVVLIPYHGQLESCDDLTIGYLGENTKDALIGLKQTILKLLPKINNSLNNTLIDIEKEIKKHD